MMMAVAVAVAVVVVVVVVTLATRRMWDILLRIDQYVCRRRCVFWLGCGSFREIKYEETFHAFIPKTVILNLLL